MAKITPIRVTEQFQHFLEVLKESFWGDLYGQTRRAWKRFWDQSGMTGWIRPRGRITATDFMSGTT